MTSIPQVPALLDPMAIPRRTAKIHTAIKTLEGAGFPVRRPFPGPVSYPETDPFLLLDHLGAIEYAPGEAKGAPDHPHRGFETVTYMLNGELEHRDSFGGGGIIQNGDTQWMTAGAGLVHSEMPTEKVIRQGGLFHGLQIWVNLPIDKKMSAPQYQDIGNAQVPELMTEDGGVLIRLIAGKIGEVMGAGKTVTPILLAHSTFSPNAQLNLPLPASFNAMVYVLSGKGLVLPDATSISEGQLAILEAGDFIRVQSGSEGLDIIILSGQPIKQPMAWYGPFVMTTRSELIEAMEDYQSGRMGHIPIRHVSPEAP